MSHGPDHISFHWSIWKTVDYRLVSAKEAKEAKDEGGNIECRDLVDKLCATSPTIKAAVVSAEMFVAMAKPATAHVALELIEKGLEISDGIISRVSTGEAERLEQIDAGQEYSRTSAQKLCEERGGRLAYRREIVDEDTKTLLINDGKPMDGPHGGHTWTAVLDGDPKKDKEGVGWVQLGVADGAQKVGQSHKEIHHGDNGWGGPGNAHGGIKCRYIWCVIEGPPLVGLVLSKEAKAVELVDLLLAKSPLLAAPAIVAACSPRSAATAVKLLEAYPSVAIDAASIEPLLAKDGERLRKLVLDETMESYQLVDALCTKSDAVKEAAASPKMLSAALLPSEARLVLRFVDAKGTGDGYGSLESVLRNRRRGAHREKRRSRRRLVMMMTRFRMAER